MDSASVYALVYSLVMIAVVGVMLFMTRPPSVATATPSMSGMPAVDVRKYGGVLGTFVPYILLGVGPLVDLYNREFKYSILTVIGSASVLVGYVYQYMLRGSSAFLPALTIATSAVVSYLMYDVWVQGTGRTYTILATILGFAVIGAQAMTNQSTTIFASKTTNDLATVGLGLALGALSWIIVWNTDKSYLFQTQKNQNQT